MPCKALDRVVNKAKEIFSTCMTIKSFILRSAGGPNNVSVQRKNVYKTLISMLLVKHTGPTTGKSNEKRTTHLKIVECLESKLEFFGWVPVCEL